MGIRLQITCCLVFSLPVVNQLGAQAIDNQIISGDMRSATAFRPSQLAKTATVTEYLHVLSTGQSLALGMTSVPALSTTQPYDNLSLSNNLLGFAAPLIDLVESFNMESPSSGIANTLHAMDTLSRPVVIGLHASSGSPYLDLKKGSGPYTRAMAQVTNAKAEVAAMGGNAVYRPVGVTVVHGEADNYAGNASQYQGYLEEWQHDYEADISAAMGSPVTFPMFVSQMNTGWTGEMALAQLKAHKDNPGKIILIGPKYFYSYTDDLHLENFESKHLGEMFGKVIHQTVLLGNPWSPLMPTAVNRIGNVITLDFHIPYGALALDTVSIAKRPNYGFEFLQTGGNTVDIVSVALVNGNTQVEVTLDAIPTGSDQLLRYAYTCYHGGTDFGMCGNAEDSSSVGGNLRDTDSRVSPAIGSTGIPLYDWGVTFEEPVVDQLASVTETAVTEWLVFPNPTHSQLSVAFRKGRQAIKVLILMDLSGKEVRRWSDFGGASEVTVDVGNVPAGLFLLKVQLQDGEQAIFKVVIDA